MENLFSENYSKNNEIINTNKINIKISPSNSLNSKKSTSGEIDKIIDSKTIKTIYKDLFITSTRITIPKNLEKLQDTCLTMLNISNEALKNKIEIPDYHYIIINNLTECLLKNIEKINLLNFIEFINNLNVFLKFKAEAGYATYRNNSIKKFHYIYNFIYNLEDREVKNSFNKAYNELIKINSGTFRNEK